MAHIKTLMRIATSFVLLVQSFVPQSGTDSIFVAFSFTPKLHILCSTYFWGWLIGQSCGPSLRGSIDCLAPKWKRTYTVYQLFSIAIFTARCTLVQSAVMRLLIVCPSVCPSGTFRYRDHIGWNFSKIISRPNSLRPSPGLTPKWAIWCNGNTPKIGAE